MSDFEYTLEVIAGAEKAKHAITLPCVIGRGEESDVTVEDGSVSKQHSRLLKQGDEVVVLDLKSANGTYVNGKRVEARVINSGDVISCASVQLRFIASPVAGSTENPGEAASAALSPGEGSSDSGASTAGYESAHASAPDSAETGPKLTLAEKLMASFDRVFLPFYRKTFAAIAFPKILIPLVVMVFIVLVVLTLTPQIQQTQDIIRVEAEKRTGLMAKRLLELNKIYLDQDKDHLLTVAPILDEPEVVDAYIATPDGKIMAPERRYGQFVTRPQALRAVKSDVSYIESFGLFGIIASQPVYRYSQSKGANEVYAVSVVVSSTRGVQLEKSSMIVLWLQVLLFIIASGVLVSFLFIRIFTQPWKDLEAQIENALQSSDMNEIPLVMNFDPVKHTTRAVNSLLFKAREGGSGSDHTSAEETKLEATFLEVSDLGEVLNRHIHETDAEWIKEKIEAFETGASLGDIEAQLGEWFESQKELIEKQASMSKTFSSWEAVVTCLKKETQFVLIFSHLSEG
jgi:hypothetical protein